MRKFYAILTLIFAACMFTRSATITGPVYLSYSNLPYAGEILLRPVSTPLPNSPNLITGGDFKVSTDTNGLFSVDLQPGNYRVVVGADKAFVIDVPNDSNTYTLLSRITNALAWNSQVYPFTNVQTATATQSGIVKTYSTQANPVVWTTNDTAALATLVGGSGPGKLDATNGVASNLSGTVTQGFKPDSKASRTWANDAGSLYTLGDSFTYGAAASSYTNTYVSKMAASVGLSAVNLANGSFTISDTTWAAFSGWTVTNTTGPSSYAFNAPSSVTEDHNWTVLVGFNDIRTSTTSASMYRKGLDHLIHWLAIPGSAKRTAQAPDSSTGTWTPIPWSNGMGSMGAYSSSGTLTFNNVIGNDIYLAYIGWGTNFGGTIALTIDGASITNFSTASVAYGNRVYINGSDASIPNYTGPYGNGKIDFCPQIIRATDLGFGAHTVVVTASANPVYVLWCAGNGFSRSIRKGPNVFIGSIPRQSPWTAGGTDALHAAFNLQLQQAVTAAKASGLRVALAPVANDYLPSTMQSGDGVHPTDAGHTAIAAAFEKAFQTDIPSISGGVTSVASSSGGGGGGAGSFTSLSVSGTSTLTGNATLSGRLLNLPTASAGGTSSRFGAGGVGASSVNIVHSDTSLDRTLNVVGNALNVTVTSTGASSDLFLGTSGFNANVQGNLIVQGTGTYSGVQTINNRLLVLPTLAGGGTSHRFGNGLVSGSSIILNASDNTLDRELTITGNGFSSKVNSTGAAADMFVGTSGQNFSVLGNETVAGTLGVTGITTLNNRLLVTPTATSGGFAHRFGSGAVSASAIVFTASDTALDRALNIVGNGISATVNSTGAGASLGLGTAGFATAVQGDLTVAGASTLTGLLTANGGVSYSKTLNSGSGTDTLESIAYTVNQTGTASSRGINIAMTPTALGSGTHRLINASTSGTDRFYVQSDGRVVVVSPNGTAGVLFRGDTSTDSRMLFNYAATLDRQLTFTGNQIYVRDAGTGATANTLALGESTSTVAIQGNETVGGTTVIGTTGTTTGSVGLKGSTSGQVTLSVAPAAGTWTMKLPTADGTTGQFLKTDGAGQLSFQTISGGGDALVANPLSQFAATTSAQLAGVISDETGTGKAVFDTAPTFSSSITLGATGGTTGSASFKGTTSGTVNMTVAAAAGSHTITLPTADGLPGQVVYTDGAGQWGWDYPTGSASKYVLFDDFVYGTVGSTTGPWTVNGANVTQVGSQAVNRPGVLQLTTASLSTGQAFFHNGITEYVFGGGAVSLEWSARLTTAIPDGVQTYSMWMGFHDVTTAKDAVDGAYFYLDSASANWQCVTSKASTRTTNSSGVAAVNGTWVKFRIDINAACTSITFYINGTLVATSTTNLPDTTSNNCGIMFNILKSLGTTPSIFQVDYVRMTQQFTTSR